MLKKVSMVSRYLLGLIFFLSGIVGLLNLVPPPADMPPALMEFFKGMMAAKYFFPFLKATETVAGLLLIVGIAPALMLLILAPVTIHIFLVHAFLTPGLENLVLPIAMIALHVLASVNYWSVFKPLLNKNK